MKKTVFFILIFSMALLGCKETKKQQESPLLDSDPMSQSPTLSSPPPREKQGAEIKITPIEHATAVLEWGDITIYIDPVGGAEAFEGQKEPDLILITDIHGDHLSVETLEALNTSNAKIMVPQAVAAKIPSAFPPPLAILNNGDQKERYGITVEAIPMYNLREEALKFHEKGRGVVT